MKTAACLCAPVCTVLWHQNGGHRHLQPISRPRRSSSRAAQVRAADTALTVVSEAKAGQGSGSYLPQALGIWLARARGADFYTMLRTGRICNLLLYLALAALAAALAPAGVRGLLACVALLPMPLQLAGSLSPDASVLGTVFCYTALCLRLCGKKAALWEKLLLVVLGGIGWPCQGHLSARGAALLCHTGG